jgi:hypothetical protein
VPVSRPKPSDLPFAVLVQFRTPREVVLYALHDSTETGVSVRHGVASIGGNLVATLGDTLVIQTLRIRDLRGPASAEGIITLLPDSARGVQVTRVLPRLSYKKSERLEKVTRLTLFLVWFVPLMSCCWPGVRD